MFIIIVITLCKVFPLNTFQKSGKYKIICLSQLVLQEKKSLFTTLLTAQIDTAALLALSDHHIPPAGGCSNNPDVDLVARRQRLSPPPTDGAQHPPLLLLACVGLPRSARTTLHRQAHFHRA